jgi:hypothetical protein
VFNYMFTNCVVLLSLLLHLDFICMKTNVNAHLDKQEESQL